MKRHFISCFLLVECISTAFTNKSALEGNRPNWIEYKLDKVWTFDAPTGAKINYIQGVDSNPGNIVLKNDTIKLNFDSTYEYSQDSTCSISNNVARAKSEIKRGAFNYLSRTGALHNFKVDTINSMAATIITPQKIGLGETDIFIENCKFHRGLGIYGRNLSASKQKLVLEIFKSIQCKASK